MHPLWVVSLAILIANDHYFKSAGILPGWLTGKLSDFAGLLVAPAVLAAALFVSTRRGVVLAHAAVAAVFAVIKIAPAAARAFEALAALTPFPWRITVDPTDLIALPMVAASYLVLVPIMEGAWGEPARRAPKAPSVPLAEPIAERALLMIGSIACMATSPPPSPNPCSQSPNGCAPVANETGALVLGNATTEERLVRLRRLDPGVVMNCDTLMNDPTTALSRELFLPAEGWLIQPNRALVLGNTRECTAFLVDADGLDMTLLAWRTDDFVTTNLATSLNVDATRELRLTLNESLGRLELADHQVIFEAPPVEDPGPAQGCETPGDEAAVAWSTPVPLGSHEISAVTTAPDGCTAIDFIGAPRFYLCVPEGAFPFQVGESLTLQSWVAPGGKTYTEAGIESPKSSGLLLESATASMIVSRGNALPRWSSPDFDDYSAEAEPVSGCSGAHDECGSLVIPMEVSLFGGASPEITFLRAGKEATLAQGAGTLYLVRSQAMPIRDSACTPADTGERLFESVLVRKN
jgi:hypothetical protein